MTDPQDPFAAPGEGSTPPPPPPPVYGAPPPAYGAPAYGTPLYGEPAASRDFAPWGLRVVASLIDFAIIAAVELVFYAVSKQLAQLAGLGVEVYFAYLVGTKGQSPGKQVMKIRIVRDADGSLLGFGTAVLRWLAHIVDGITCGLGFLWPLWDKKNQTFADKIVGSVAVRA